MPNTTEKIIERTKRLDSEFREMLSSFMTMATFEMSRDFYTGEVVIVITGNTNS